MSSENNIAFSVPISHHQPHQIHHQGPPPPHVVQQHQQPRLQHHLSNGNMVLGDLSIGALSLGSTGVPAVSHSQQPQAQPQHQQQQQQQQQLPPQVQQQAPSQVQQQGLSQVQGQQQQQQQQQQAPTEPFALRLSNLPQDLTKRESSLMFALVIDDIVNIEQNGEDIVAYFKTLNTCITTGKLLEGKYLFGSDLLPIKVEYDNHFLGPVFNSLRLSSSNISPPHVNSSTSEYQKRQSIGNQRSRFLFSDPFSGSTTPTSAMAPNSAASAASSGSQPAPGSTAAGGQRIDLSDLSGKSLLLMESQNDAREYEQLVRDPWSTTTNVNAASTPSGSSPSENPSSQDQINGSQSTLTNSAPQSSAASVQPQGPFDWASAASAAASNADRRRTSSAFFNSNPSQLPPSNPLSSTASGNIPIHQPIQQMSLSHGLSNQTPQQLQLQQLQLQPQASAQNQVPVQQQQQQQQQTQLNQLQANQQPASQSPPQSQAQTSSNQQSPQSQASGGARQLKDVPDLSLLARVPPPANPADQNPPCNTLYVGNLPPDATEVELRALFSPQKGFRRLSFRTKTQSQSNPNANSHNHGPMCFVEFEDVAHATRALAELYGRALPRPGGSNGKGGIRLSFSKNPLGVRGPGNPRRTSSSQVLNGSSPTSSSGTGNGQSGNPALQQPQQLQPQLSLQSQLQQLQLQPASVNSNGIGNYGYLGFHKA